MLFGATGVVGSPLLVPQVFNSSPDETANFRIMLDRQTCSNCLIMIQPTLHCYSMKGPPSAVLLDSQTGGCLVFFCTPLTWMRHPCGIGTNSVLGVETARGGDLHSSICAIFFQRFPEEKEIAQKHFLPFLGRIFPMCFAAEF